jgi:ectoine hydroxylase-related dioxygenase (phytanoyl-CoA dioxygenase family)
MDRDNDQRGRRAVSDTRAEFRLSEAQVNKFWNDGYLMLTDVIGLDEVERMRASMAAILERGIGHESWADDFDVGPAGKTVRERALIRDIHRLSPVVNNSTYRRIGESIANQLLGAGVFFSSSYGFYKPPRVGVSIPWHQGCGFFPMGSSAELLSFWMPFQEVTVENGCLYYIPGSHRSGMLPHYNYNEDPTLPNLIVIEPRHVEREQDQQACVMGPGGIVFHNSRAVHRSNPNLSPDPRLAVILDFVHPTWYDSHQIPESTS